MSDDVQEGFRESGTVEKLAFTNPLTAGVGALALGARTSTHRTLRKAGFFDQISLPGSKTPEEIRRESVAAGILGGREQKEQKPGRKQTTLTQSQPRKSILG